LSTAAVLRRCAAALLALTCVFAGSRVGAQSLMSADDATFQLMTMTQDGSAYRSAMLGTAFFVDSDGTALTNTHVVYLAQQNPARFRLLALVGDEFYSAVLVCAAALPYDPERGQAVLSRDIAVVKVGPSEFPFTHLSYGDGGPDYTAHVAPLPSFRRLALGGDPPVGSAVWVLGYGHIADRFAPTPGMRWIAGGTVDQLRTASDGTHVFRVASTNRPGAGNSGAPVVDTVGRVVGMWTWAETDNRTYGVAIGSSTLARPCGKIGAAPASLRTVH
jgi:S1-C subfamily serine protease